MKAPFLIFYDQELIVTDYSKISADSFDVVSKSLQVFDSQGYLLNVKQNENVIEFFLSPDAKTQEYLLQQKLLEFWKNCGKDLSVFNQKNCKQILEVCLSWINKTEWKNYRRRKKLFWTMMVPCGIVPLILGFVQIIRAQKLEIFFIIAGALIALFLFAGLLFLERKLYPRPKIL